MAVDEAAILAELRTLITPASLDGECSAAPVGHAQAAGLADEAAVRVRSVRAGGGHASLPSAMSAG